MTDLNLGVIGNCSYSALIDQRGRIVWACLPHFDDDPVFNALVAGPEPESGFCDVAVDNFAHSTQQYIANTAILVTTVYDTSGCAVEITDFAPRFIQFGRSFRPTMLIRSIRPVRGTPRIRLRVRPTFDYGAGRPERTRGSNHIRFVSPNITLRLTTDAPISYIMDEVPFVLEEPVHLVLGPDESLTRDVTTVVHEFLERTHTYWIEFSRHLSIPFEWQEAVIRAAITLKLCSFEESGAVIAAMTTSIPEAPHSGRNWDYRYCWLRDAYFVVHALNRLGVTDTLERYLHYITNLAVSAEDGYLQPVYGIELQARLEERVVPALGGYRGMGPVRVGNQAYMQVQNDGYGSAILAVTQAFFDRRLSRPGTLELFRRLEKLGEQAARRFDQPDAGPWELREQQQIHTYSSVICWAACDRLAKIASRLGLAERAKHWRGRADEMRSVILHRTWNDRLKRFVSTFEGEGIDASLLLLHELGFVDADDTRFRSTVVELEKVLRNGNRLFRYTEDDYGHPETAFTICTFWYVDALDAVGRRAEARDLFEDLLERRNHLGLLSEDIHPQTGELWGNFPQTYSMVGLINSAMRLSDPWETAF
jgi:GH15 family glucan-1,4-alpha-glucosidase